MERNPADEAGRNAVTRHRISQHPQVAITTNRYGSAEVRISVSMDEAIYQVTHVLKRGEPTREEVLTVGKRGGTRVSTTSGEQPASKIMDAPVKDDSGITIQLVSSDDHIATPEPERLNHRSALDRNVDDVQPYQQNTSTEIDNKTGCNSRRSNI